MMRWLDILYAVYNISSNAETYTQIIFKKKIFSVWYKKTHKKVNETQHCTTKLMLESHNFIMCDAEMLNKWIYTTTKIVRVNILYQL